MARRGLHDVTVTVAAALDDHRPYDVVIITLLAHQVDEQPAALQRSAAGCIFFNFSTFHAERLQDSIGVERCAFGMPLVQATLDSEGKIRATIGAGGQKTLMGQQRWADVFNAAGLPATVERDMPLWLRCHVPLCVAFESVAPSMARRVEAARLGNRPSILARVINTGSRLIEALGPSIDPRANS